MAIYSLNHKSVGKATQDKAFTAAAHVKYITRASACREVVGNRMPIDPGKAQNWYKVEEAADRKNARVCDKVMVALPRELDAEQRVALVRDFAERVTQGKAPWLAAVHDMGKDRSNPHCHIVFRDRDARGKRCLHMSAGKAERALLKEKGIDAMTTDRMRGMWEHAANEHLERAGHRERIDRRSLKAQGIEREPTVHEGVQARQMAARGERPQSKVVGITNAPTARSERRSVDYSAIDRGKTRQEHNAAIIRLSERRQKKDQKSLARSAELRDNFAYGREKPPGVVGTYPQGKSGGGSRAGFLGRPNSNADHNAREANRDRQPQWSSDEQNTDQSRPDDRRRSEIAGYRNRSPEQNSRAGKSNIERNVQFLNSPHGRGQSMTDEDRLNDILKSRSTERERLDILKEYHKKSQRDILENSREHQSGKKSDKEAKADYEAFQNMKNLTEKRLIGTEAGKKYLHGKESRDVKEALHKEDAEARKKAEQEKETARIQKELEKKPPMKAAEVPEKEIDLDAGKKKAAEIAAFLAAQAEKKKKQRQSGSAISHEDEKNKQSQSSAGSSLGDDYGM